jgi:uncharacterized RDD family membrane protein YckC
MATTAIKVSGVSGSFDPSAVKAPFPLRIASAAVDYIFIFLFPVFALLISATFLDKAHAPRIGFWGWMLTLLAFFVNEVALPLLFGKTLGKWLFGLSIVSDTGEAVSLGKILLRNVFGYLLVLATFGIGFIVAAFGSRGKTLHDIISGTVVIRGTKRIAKH